MHPNCRRGSLPNIRGSRLSAVPFCISILTSVRRIIKIAVRFLHTKTALCDRKDTQSRFAVNAARSIVCVETRACGEQRAADLGFNAARSIVCVETRSSWRTSSSTSRFQCRTQHCVCRDVLPPNGDESAMSFNAARSIVCVETLCPAALVPRGLRRHFGKTRFFAPFLASADELCPEKWGSHRRCPLCGAGCTVLERRNGGMRLCARAGALSISFSSYLMIAHASFFFNDVFASMQRGR